MKKYSIGLDLGTSSVKAVLFSKEDGIVAKETAGFEYKQSYLPGGAEYLGIDAEKFYKTVVSVIGRLAARLPSGATVLGLSMASASGNSILCDRDGKAIIDGYSWLNKPFNEEIKSVFGDDFGSEVREKAGWGLSGSFPLGQLSHLRLNAPELLDRADRVCMMTEYVLHRLTGRWGIDVSTATPFSILDQKAREWNREYLDALGIEEKKLPPLMESGQLLGELTLEGSTDTGLPSGVKVYLGSFDHPSAARANDIRRQGELLVSCGTSWVCFFPISDRAKIIEHSYLCDPFLTPEGPWGAMASLARASERIKEIVDRYISDGEDKFEVLDSLVALAEPGAGGLVLNPMGELADLSGYPKENIARALMEGIATELKKRVSGVVEVNRIAMCGGPSVSKMWRQVISEVFGVPVTVTYGAYSGAVGAAMHAFN